MSSVSLLKAETEDNRAELIYMLPHKDLLNDGPTCSHCYDLSVVLSLYM